jgi:hypothetical protein
VTPFKVLTGDWYHFQDAWDALPVDLQGVLEMIPGSSNTTSYDPEKTESNGSVPDGCTKGGFDIGKNNGGIRWHLTDGVLQLKINLHFTGDRTFNIKWTLANGQSGFYSTGKLKKTTLLEWDMIEVAGISEDVAKQIRTIELLNAASGGGARVYDMYVRVPDTSATTAITVTAAKAALSRECTVKTMENGRIVIIKNGQRYNLQGQSVGTSELEKSKTR